MNDYEHAEADKQKNEAQEEKDRLARKKAREISK